MASSVELTLVATNVQSNEQALTNCAFVHAGELAKLAAAAGVDAEVAAKKGLLCAVGEAVLLVRALDSAMPGRIYVSMSHRMAGGLSPDKPCKVRYFPTPPAVPPFFCGRLQLELSTVGGSASDAPLVVDAGELSRIFADNFNWHVFKLGQQVNCAYAPDGESGKKAVLKLVVLGFEYSDAAGGAGAGAAGGAAAAGAVKYGQLNKKLTTIELVKNAKANIKITGSSTGKANQLFEKGFNFEEMGIGGLDAQFKEIFRRAFASRLVPPEILKKMGQHHIRGMLLFGPPGCGKTLIARKIGKALHAKPPKIVNGPEILNKYVGASEENIRALFKDAEDEQAEKGDDSELHIIIFDEFDAISKVRGTTGGGTGVNDSIVNQLLSKIDGVESLNSERPARGLERAPRALARARALARTPAIAAAEPALASLPLSLERRRAHHRDDEPQGHDRRGRAAPGPSRAARRDRPSRRGRPQADSGHPHARDPAERLPGPACRPEQHRGAHQELHGRRDRGPGQGGLLVRLLARRRPDQPGEGRGLLGHHGGTRGL